MKRADPRDSHIWYDLGVILYELACLDALENNPAAAFGKLCKSIEREFRNADCLRKDPDLKSLREDPR